jgi:hypothetical protein
MPRRAIFALLLLGGCNDDPVHASAVAALPAEVAGIAPGELHRAGQPCLTCHGGEGPASQRLVIGGSVFFGPGTNAAAVGTGGVQVLLEDDSQSRFVVTTNCAGNFFIKPEEWPGHPQFPILVRVVGSAGESIIDVAMQSHIGRSGSCADCHQLSTNENWFQTPGLIHLIPEDDPQLGAPSCPANPSFANP